jgi:hypothetical protein
MTTAAATARTAQVPYTLVSTTARVVTALAVTATLATFWLSAERASHHAVQAHSQAFSRNVTYVTLPTVQVVGQREPAAMAASAALAPQSRNGRVERVL